MRPGHGLGVSAPRRRSELAGLFRPGDLGFWFDPSDLGNLFQDAAGTIPVTGPDQPVVLIRDLSGRGLHAAQPVAAARPTLRQDEAGRWYLDFDGVDDFLATAAVRLNSNKATVIAGLLKNSDATAGVVLETSPNVTSFGGVLMLAPLVAGAAGWGGRAAMQSTTGNTGGPLPVSTRAVVGLTTDADLPLLAARRDGVQIATSTRSQSTSAYGLHPIHVGCRNGVSTYFNGRLYGLLLINRVLGAAELAAVEGWMVARTGVSP